MDSLFARQLIAFAFVAFAFIGTANAYTRADAWEQCNAIVSASQAINCYGSPPGECPTSCQEQPHWNPAFSVVVCHREDPAKGTCGTSPAFANGDTGCSAGGDAFDGSLAGSIGPGGTFCGDNGCEYEQTCGAGQGCVSMEIGGRTYGAFEQTGDTCTPTYGGGGEGPSGANSDHCKDVGGGYSQCREDDQICVNTPKGSEFCWTPSEDQPKFQQENHEAGDKSPGNEPPPKEDGETEYEETSRTDSTVNGQPTTITTYENEPDQDDDGNPDDEDNDNDNDGVPDEEDDEEEEITASLSGCDSTPSCSDPGSVECAHYLVAHKHRCDVHGVSAGGGATCDSPPSCQHVDPVQCAQLRQLWRIRCDSDQKISGGNTCASAPVCERASSPDCNAAQQLWKIQCGINPAITGGTSCDAPPACSDTSATCRQVKLLHAQVCEAQDGNETLSTISEEVTRTADGVETLGEGIDSLVEVAEQTGSATAVCENPPACSMVDGIGCAILRQQWQTMCAIKEYQSTNGTIAEQFEPGGDVEGPPNDGDPDALFYDPVAESGSFPGMDGGWEPRGACPVNIGFNVGIGNFVIPPTFPCMFLDALAGLVLLSGVVLSGFIIAGVRR